MSVENGIPPPSDVVPSTVRPWIDKAAADKARERMEDDMAAAAARQSGIAAGAATHGNVVAAAQAVARKLGQFGAVTIDDVVREMERIGWTNLRGEHGGKAKNWKGSVFSDSEWACIGSIASRDVTAKGRHVRQWATKEWLRKHPVNGTNSDASAFSLWKIYQEASHSYPAGTELAFILGSDMVDSSFENLVSGQNIRYRPDGTVVGQNMSLYGCRVYVVKGIGATMVPLRAMDSVIKQLSLAHSASGSGDVR